jgi:cyanate permease
MKFKFHYITTLVLIASIASIFYGFYIKTEQLILAHKYIGFGTVGIFFVAMPLFLYRASQGKNVKDYMLNEENIRKMNSNETKKSENQ